MTKVIMNGCNGHMGHVISDLCEKDPEIEIVAGIDINTEQHYGYPVFANIADCDVAADASLIFHMSAASMPDGIQCIPSDPGGCMHHRSFRGAGCPVKNIQ